MKAVATTCYHASRRRGRPQVSENYGIKSYADLSRIYAAWARGRLQDPEVGAEELERVLSAFLAQGQKVETPSCYGMLAELEAMPRTGRS